MTKEYLRLSYSSGNVFESCARKFELDKLYPKRMPKEDAYAADVGSALHHGYQHYLIHGNAEQATWEFMRKFPYELEFMEQNDYRSAEASLATFEEMITSHSMGDYALAEIKRPLNDADRAELNQAQAEGKLLDFDASGRIVPAVEVPFEIRFEGIDLPPTPKYPNGCGVAFIGYIDAIMRNLLTDMYRTMDIKTHRDNLLDRTGKYKFDSQQTPYGIVVDHVAGVPITEFEVLYYDCKIDIIEPRVQLYKFKRSQNDIQEWLFSKVLQLQMIQKYAATDFFPRTSGGCMFYNRPCRYLDPCVSRDREVLENWFMMGHEPAEERPWEPWVVTTINPFGDNQ